MSEDGNESAIDRRTILKNAAAGVAGVGGLALVSGSADADVSPHAVRTQGDLDPVEAAAKLQQVESFDGVDTQDDCYTETKCYSGCSGNGKIAYRECCPGIVGCGECCDSWTYTDTCC